MTTTAEKPMKFGVSTVICYDRHFSEGPRALALNCCDLMFVPTATAAGMTIRELELQARSLRRNPQSATPATREERGRRQCQS